MSLYGDPDWNEPPDSTNGPDTTGNPNTGDGSSGYGGNTGGNYGGGYGGSPTDNSGGGGTYAGGNAGPGGYAPPEVTTGTDTRSSLPGANAASDYAQQQMLDAAKGVSNAGRGTDIGLNGGPAAQAYTSTIDGQSPNTAMNNHLPTASENAIPSGPNPDMNPDGTYKSLDAAQRAGFSAADAPVSTPSSSALPGANYTAPTGGNGALSNQAWQDQFTKTEGYFDPRYNSRDNLLANAQQGDTRVLSQLADMAKYDADAKRVLDAITAQNGGNLSPQGNFYNSQNAVNWDVRHNADVQARTAAGDFTGGAAGRTALQNEQVRVPLDAIPNARAFPEQAQMVDILTKQGASNATINPYGGVTWTGTDGQTYGIGVGPNGEPVRNVSMADIHGALAQLHTEAQQQAAQQQAAAAQQAAAPQQQQSYNAPQRSYSAPQRNYGNGGGYNAPAPQQPSGGVPGPVASDNLAQRYGNPPSTPLGYIPQGDGVTPDTTAQQYARNNYLNGNYAAQP